VIAKTAKPKKKWRLARIISAVLSLLTILDWLSDKTESTAADKCFESREKTEVR